MVAGRGARVRARSILAAGACVGAAAGIGVVVPFFFTATVYWAAFLVGVAIVGVLAGALAGGLVATFAVLGRRLALRGGGATGVVVTAAVLGLALGLVLVGGAVLLPLAVGWPSLGVLVVVVAGCILTDHLERQAN